MVNSVRYKFDCTGWPASAWRQTFNLYLHCTAREGHLHKSCQQDLIKGHIKHSQYFLQVEMHFKKYVIQAAFFLQGGSRLRFFGEVLPTRSAK